MKILALACFIGVLWKALGTSPEVNTTLDETEGSNILKFDAVQVKTPLGEIEGVMSQLNGAPVKMFLGIPYATPPVGSLRFLKPNPLEPWNDALQAKNQPPACMQYTEGPFPWYDDMPGKSEDCLYLNIYAPFFATEGSKLAVLFWIHGGGYTLGSNRMDVYDGRPLAEREGVIVVTVNYRMGLFGFLTSNTDDAPGNMGMYDLVMALQWVNDNIEYFGGDKARITIIGESAGSSAASALCVSPLTTGLFSRAILQSASITKHIYNKLDSNLRLAERLAEAVDCATKNFTIYDNPTEVVQCLREKNATHLMKTLTSFFPLYTGSFSPQYGDSLLPNNAVEDILNGSVHNVPILTGALTDEGSFFITMLYANELGFFGEKDTQVNKTFATTMLQLAFGNFTDPQKYIDFYLKDVPDDDYDLIRKQVHTAYGDTIITCPTVYFAEKYAERNNDVYFYFFNHRPSNTPWAEWLGVAHFEEVQFVFGRPVRVPEDYNTAEVALSAQVMKLWANFAKDGHPGKLCSDLYLNWPKYSKENPTYLNMDTENFGSLGTGPAQENCNFLRSYYGF
ncbi:Acetylcholinesterase-1 [Araneus ventricosus]|uniref:Carboxylic ester hydrolase n=1 Tax=Araneus ventricosus TaxID=182803 RepID=A0A4Y2K1S9_ARAVE|nr:Acetylcholinesterase-1 [Araneus ventricosus]